jgi:short-subunit dehydrogenase
LKTILITGASSGIGRALAVQAARAGYAVYAVGRSVRALAALAGQIGEEGGTIVTDATDISDPANAPGLIGRAVGAYGHVDVLVNNAGAAAVGPIATQSDEQLRAQFGTHVVGPLALTREALPTLRASRGHVFMLGSGVARVPVPGMGAYPPSKAALRSATSILRREVAPLDIAVTYVDPGAVDTGFMTRAGMPGAPRDVLVSPELVARKILLAIATRPRTINVALLQTAAVAVAEIFPQLAEAVLEHNPNLIGAGPTMAAFDVQRDNNGGRGEKIALPSKPAMPIATEATVESPPPLAPTFIPREPVAAPEPTDVIEAVVIPASIAVSEPPPDAGLDVTIAPVVPPPFNPPPARWTFEPPETELELEDEAAAAVADSEHPFPDERAADHDIEPSVSGSSFDAALEPLQRRMERAKLTTSFIRSLLVVDAVIDVGDAAMRWAGMPNKHERALTSEVFFALAEWGFLAPRADGRYRVVVDADGDPAV